ncbi:MAG: N-acetylmuramoyl-L-alanine amidase-like domain-containing protein [Bacteroidales bacterium]
MEKTKNIMPLLLIIILLCYPSVSNGQWQNDELNSNNPFICKTNENINTHILADDSLVFSKAIQHVKQSFLELPDSPETSSIIINTTQFFLNTPYTAHTLEIPGEEQLVVNLREMDCTTFVEYVVALTLLIQENRTDFERFTELLACVRYRDGIIDGYPSRLHYFTEWLQNNARKGILEIVSNELSNEPYNTDVSFMSSNTGLYRQLENPEYVSRIKETEKIISGYEMNFIPKDQILENESHIKDGDIIAFTTNITGLDVSHTGFAFYQNGRLYLLHASTRTNQVEISPVPLSDYLAPMSRVTGILVGRIK